MANVIQRTDSRTAVLDLESVQLQNNIIMVTGDITQESVAEWQSMLFYLMQQNQDSKDTPIQLYINSNGGSVYSGLGLYDTIQYAISKGYVIKTVNIGICASMAAVILLSGSQGYRHSYPNASVMLHELSYGNWGKYSEMKDSHEESTRIKNIIDSIICKHTDFNPIDMDRKDVWMGTDDALKYKIIDKTL